MSKKCRTVFWGVPKMSPGQNENVGTPLGRPTKCLRAVGKMSEPILKCQKNVPKMSEPLLKCPKNVPKMSESILKCQKNVGAAFKMSKKCRSRF